MDARQQHPALAPDTYREAAGLIERLHSLSTKTDWQYGASLSGALGIALLGLAPIAMELGSLPAAKATGQTTAARGRPMASSARSATPSAAAKPQQGASPLPDLLIAAVKAQPGITAADLTTTLIAATPTLRANIIGRVRGDAIRSGQIEERNGLLYPTYGIAADASPAETIWAALGAYPRGATKGELIGLYMAKYDGGAITTALSELQQSGRVEQHANRWVQAAGVAKGTSGDTIVADKAPADGAQQPESETAREPADATN